jgi:hypothetical protein
MLATLQEFFIVVSFVFLAAPQARRVKEWGKNKSAAGLGFSAWPAALWVFAMLSWV